jgi:hypothetical protein
MAVRGVLFLCLIANLCVLAHPPVARGACDFSLRAGGDSDGISRWAPSHAGGELFSGALQRGRFVARVASTRHAPTGRTLAHRSAPSAHTPHRPSAAHRHHLKLLAGLSGDDDSPA